MDYNDFLQMVIEGNWNSSQEGYIIYTPEKEIISIEELESDILLADRQNVENLLFEDCCKVIEQFSKTQNNIDVYAVTLFIDTEGGANGISINTESEYTKRIKECYSDYSKEELSGIHDVKYNEGDFNYRYFNDDFVGSELKMIMDAYYCISAEHPIIDVSKKIGFSKSFFEGELIQIGIRVVKRLRETMSLLNKTVNFIAFVSLHEIDGENKIRLMKCTIDSNTFNQLFPEINHFENFKQLIANQGVEKQIDFWINTYMDFEFDLETDATKNIKSFKRDRYDVKNEIKGLDKLAVPKLVSLIEKYGVMNQINYKWTIPVSERIKFMRSIEEKDKDKYRAFTKESDITSHLLLIVMDIGNADDESVEKLHKLLEILFDNSKGEEIIGTNLSLVARTLRRIRPDKYPKAEIGPSNNHLINYIDFGLK